MPATVSTMKAFTIDDVFALGFQLKNSLSGGPHRGAVLGACNLDTATQTWKSPIDERLQSRFDAHQLEYPKGAVHRFTIKIEVPMQILFDVADSLREKYGHKCSKPCMESQLAALCFSMGVPINTFSNPQVLEWRSDTMLTPWLHDGTWY
jgi:hypothetical protein